MEVAFGANGASAARADASLDIQLLGAFGLVVDGCRVDIPVSAQRVVAFLALRRQAAPRAHVAGTLWPLHSEDHAAANLRTALWRLRCQSDGIVVTSRTDLSLPPAASIDAVWLERTATGVLERSTRATEEELSELQHSEPLLTGWYDDWVVTERERLEYLRLRALESLCERLTGAGLYLEAADVGLAVVAADPLRESTQRTLIEIELARGNLREALRRYERYTELLGAELGVAPSPAMQALLRPLLSPESRARPTV